MGELLYGLQFKYMSADSPSLLVAREGGLKRDDLFSLQANMLSAHRLEGYVPFAVETLNLDTSLHYDLRDLRPLINHIRAGVVQANTLRKYYWEILSILSSSSKYMLDLNRYVLDLKYIYIDSLKENISLLYLPLQRIDGKSELAEELKTLFIDLFRLARGVELHFYNRVIDYLLKTDFQLLTLMSLVEDANLNGGTGQMEASVEPVKAIAKQRKRFNWFSRSKKSKGDPDSRKKIRVAQQDKTLDDQLGNTRKLATDAPTLTLERRANGRSEHIVMEQEHFIIGRNKGVAHHFEPSKDVSRVHLELIRDVTGFLVKDLDSKNGSYLNGEKLTPNKLYPIAAGDLIEIIGIEYYVKNIADKEGENIEGNSATTDR